MCVKPTTGVAEPETLTPPADEREASDVFQRLTPATQAKVRAAWQNEQRAAVQWQERRRESRLRTVVECTLLLGGLMLAVRGVGYAALLTVAVVGPLLGLVIDRLQPERTGTAALGFLAHCLMAVLTGLCSADVFGCVLTGTVFGAYGVRREFRSSVGES